VFISGYDHEKHDRTEAVLKPGTQESSYYSDAHQHHHVCSCFVVYKETLAFEEDSEAQSTPLASINI